MVPCDPWGVGYSGDRLEQGSMASVDVQWRPSQYAVQDPDPKDVQHAHLRVGSSLDVGGRALTVSAIEPQTADHPAWVRFEMARLRLPLTSSFSVAYRPPSHSQM
jgi:hypothetical protein